MTIEEDRAKLIAQAQALRDAGISDEQALAVLQGYREAAYYTTTTPDGEPIPQGEYAWSVEAQVAMRDDVIPFLTSNIIDVRQFVAVPTLGWLQVGIDFWLTRNRHGSGFWDRGAGAVGQRLTEAAHPYGESTVQIGDSGELEVA